MITVDYQEHFKGNINIFYFFIAKMNLKKEDIYF